MNWDASWWGMAWWGWAALAASPFVNLAVYRVTRAGGPRRWWSERKARRWYAMQVRNDR